MGPYDNEIDPEDAFLSRCRFNAATLIVCIAVYTSRLVVTWRLNEIHSMAVKYKEIDGFDNDFKIAE